MSPETFIARHGLVRYSDRLGAVFPRSGECEVRVCRQRRQESLAHGLEGKARLPEVLAEIETAGKRKAQLLASKPGTDETRRERRRHLDKIREQLRMLAGEREALITLAPMYDLMIRDGQDRPGSLVFDHCHEHG